MTLREPLPLTLDPTMPVEAFFCFDVLLSEKSYRQLLSELSRAFSSASSSSSWQAAAPPADAIRFTFLYFVMCLLRLSGASQVLTKPLLRFC